MVKYILSSPNSRSILKFSEKTEALKYLKQYPGYRLKKASFWKCYIERYHYAKEIYGKSLDTALNKHLGKILADTCFYGPYGGRLHKYEFKQTEGNWFLVISGWSFNSPWRREDVKKDKTLLKETDDDYVVYKIKILGVTEKDIQNAL